VIDEHFVVSETPEWFAFLGVMGLLGTLGSACAWRREVKVRREHEEMMRDAAERHRAKEEKVRMKVEARIRADEELRIAKAERQRREEQGRLRIESLLRRDAVRDEINYMSGAEFEKFMADLFRQKGYAVEETPASGDQGVDLILPDYDGTRVVVQLKRWSGPVGNAVVGATFAGMAHYRAEEGWIITTSTFTPKARELARSTRVRLINGKELAEWLEGLREQE
jgi:restriction endonuclease Mrr